MADLVALPPSQFDKQPHDPYLTHLDNEFWQRFRWFCDLCADRGITDQQGVTSGYRTLDEQIYLRAQNCGPTYFDIWKKPAAMCSPATAIPGTSQHGKDPAQAIDANYGYNDVAGPMRATARECGLRYTVASEDWHMEKDPTNRTQIPEKYTNPAPAPAPAPLPPEDDVARTAEVTRLSDGMMFQAIIRRNGKFEYRFTTPDRPYLWDNDWVGVVANGGPIIPFPFDTVVPMVFDDRFHIEVRNLDTGQAGIVAQLHNPDAPPGPQWPLRMDPTLYGSK